MIKRTIATLFLVIASFFVLAGVSASAKQSSHSIPNVSDSLNLSWTGSPVYGANVAWQISSPPLLGVGASTFWHRRLELVDAAEGDNTSFDEIGVERVKANITDPICNQSYSSDTSLLYENYTDVYGTHSVKCYAIGIDVPSSLNNSNMRFEIYTQYDQPQSTYYSVFDFYDSDKGNNTHITDYYLYSDPEFASIIYAETYSGDALGSTDHRIYGVHFTQSAWMDGNHNWNNQTASPYGDHISGCFSGGSGGCPSRGMPPINGGLAWYWEDGKYPANVTNGGTLDACMYGTYGSYPYCTFNS